MDKGNRWLLDTKMCEEIDLKCKYFSVFHLGNLSKGKNYYRPLPIEFYVLPILYQLIKKKKPLRARPEVPPFKVCRKLQWCQHPPHPRHTHTHFFIENLFTVNEQKVGEVASVNAQIWRKWPRKKEIHIGVLE